MSHDALDRLFADLWTAYVAITPQAERVHQLFSELGETIENDHVAFRTFDLDPVRLERLAGPFLEAGYVETGTYRFEDKKLLAKSYSYHEEGHPSGDYPRVFISELLTGELSPWLRETCQALAAQVDPSRSPRELLLAAPTWPAVSVETYDRLLDESEYAGWVSAFGLRANHFTVSVNALRRLPTVPEVNTFLKGHGFALNTAGGEVKGTPADLLEQSSTLASRVPWTFAGGVVRHIPSCYYEFALRHPDPATGRLYDGFVTQNADKIFESTHTR